MSERASDNALLVEYEVGQQFANDSQRRLWQITGILLILALSSPFGAILLMRTNSGTSSEPNHLLIAVGVLAIVLDFFWIVSWERERFYLLTTFHRLREIETLLGLRRNWYIHVLDKKKPPKYFSDAERQSWKDLLHIVKDQGLKSPPFAGKIKTIHAVWLVAITMAIFWIFVILNNFYNWFQFS